MKKLGTLFLVFALVFSLSSTAFAANNSGKDHGKSSGNSSSTVTKTSSKETKNQSAEASDTQNAESDTEDQTKSQKGQTTQKKFKDELNEQKQQLQEQKRILNQEKATLQQQYESLLASGDTAGATAILEKMNSLNTQISDLQSQVKQAVNERHMIVKTMYTEEELTQFESAADVIKQMYQDASTLEAGSVTVNNNLIKFDAPAYLKGGVTLVPIRAISEELGADVTWDQATGAVKIVKGDTVIEMTPNSSTILVNGASVDMTSSTTVTCGRTYLPLRFLAEALGFEVTWDGENQEISIDDQTDGTADTTADTTTTDTNSTTNTQ